MARTDLSTISASASHRRRRSCRREPHAWVLLFKAGVDIFGHMRYCIGKTLMPVVRVLPWCLAFAISHAQDALYSSNQNAHFLHGLAKAGQDFLAHDWMAQTADPFPVFTLLVTLTVGYTHEFNFYLYYLIVLGIYFYATMGIITQTFKLDRPLSKYVLLFAFIALHSAFISSLSIQLLGFDLRRALTWGLADQYILGPAFQPSVFGVFLLLSIYSFLRGKPFLAVIFSGCAATFHSNYILSAAVLTLSYMLLIATKERDFKKSLLVGSASLVLVLPIVFYSYLNFQGTTPDTLSQAQSILVDYRIPHHARPAEWFGVSSVIRVTIVILALFSVRKKRIFAVLLAGLIAGSLLTVIQLLTSSKFLALLFPWRISAWLVPVSTFLILANLVEKAAIAFVHSEIPGRIPRLAAITLTILLMVYGLSSFYRNYTHRSLRGDAALVDYVSSTAGRGDVILIPPDLGFFRLQTGAPVFVDWKTHPYKDTEVIEWHRRIGLANAFYEAADNESACAALEKLAGHYPITRVVVGNTLIPCTSLHLLYKDEEYSVYQVSAR